MIHLSASLTYYKREDVQKAIIEHGRDKEVAARFNEQFGKRPDTLTYPNEVLELAKQGATSFHCSEETWTNPLLLRPQMLKAELDKLRKGWDLIIDIDTSIKGEETRLEYSKIAAELVVKELKRHGVRSVTTKFSGNKGFHIAVPFEAFPKEVNGRETKELFPEAPKRIAAYIKERIKAELGRRILQHENGNYAAIAEKSGKQKSDFVYMKHAEGGFSSEAKVEFNAEPFLEIDTLLISSRHMYRMPYALHEKSGLASVPVDSDSITAFTRESARPENVEVNKYRFMEREKAVDGEARSLFIAAYDFGKDKTMKQAPESGDRKYAEYEELEGRIPQQYFPPCIKKILEGVVDGRKRALFVLINFLGSCGYGSKEIEGIIIEGNKKNREPLPPLTIATQLSYHSQKKENALPPNCENTSYYKELGIECTAECGRCKNPVAEAKYIYRKAMRQIPKEKG